MASYQERRRRRGGYQGWPLREDPGGAAGEHLSEIPNDRENIISSYAAWLKIAPDDLQIEARTLPADTADYVERMKEFAAHEPNQSCREMIEDNIAQIGQGGGQRRPAAPLLPHLPV